MGEREMGRERKKRREEEKREEKEVGERKMRDRVIGEGTER